MGTRERKHTHAPPCKSAVQVLRMGPEKSQANRTRGNIFSANKGSGVEKLRVCLLNRAVFAKFVFTVHWIFLPVGRRYEREKRTPLCRTMQPALIAHSGCITCLLPRQQSHSTAKVFNYSLTLFLLIWKIPRNKNILKVLMGNEELADKIPRNGSAFHAHKNLQIYDNFIIVLEH